MPKMKLFQAQVNGTGLQAVGVRIIRMFLFFSWLFVTFLEGQGD
jgi:hypothetical protein